MSIPCQSACTRWAELVDTEGTSWRTHITTPADEDRLDEMLAVATDLLFQWSGRKWAGACSETVAITSSRSDSDVCRLKRVKLGGYPVSSIESVTITTDGVDVLLVDGDPGGYRVDSWRWLVRIDNANGSNDGWPLDGSMVVAYVYGATPPPAGKVAAIELAGELTLAIVAPEHCKLPSKVTNIVRQGVSITYAEPGAFKQLGTVATFLDAYNPQGRRRRAGVLIPEDVQRVSRRDTGT